MERKTMGELIAILRKTKGLTQKDLSEMLNVSDKAVSRWERGESYPDIELIPVIAKLFGITADELINGCLEEKATKSRREPGMGASFRTLSLISAMLSILALITAAIINIGFFRCYVAFFASLILHVAAIFIEAIAINGTVSNEALDSNERKKEIKWGLKTISFSLLLIFFTLPLLTTGNSMVALKGESWLLTGSVFVLIGIAVLACASFFLSKLLITRNIYPLSQEELEIYRERQSRKKVIAIITTAAFIIIFFVHFALTEIPHGGTMFYDYESFGEYMAKNEKRRQYGSYYSPIVSVPTEIEEVTSVYYDRYGNEITREEAHKQHIMDLDGNVVYEYYDFNENVSSISYSPREDDCLPITVRTYDDLEEQRVRNIFIHLIFVVVYLAMLFVSFFIYFRKRPK